MQGPFLYGEFFNFPKISLKDEFSNTIYDHSYTLLVTAYTYDNLAPCQGSEALGTLTLKNNLADHNYTTGFFNLEEILYFL